MMSGNKILIIGLSSFTVDFFVYWLPHQNVCRQFGNQAEQPTYETKEVNPGQASVIWLNSRSSEIGL
jgi:hypothetical protein